MFQDINVVKSAPFALLTISQKSMYSPKVFKRPPFWQITRNSPTISLFGQRGVETSNFTANCARFAQFANHHGEPREICVIIANFYHSLLLKCTPIFLQQISQNPHNSLILGANHAKLTNFALISINLLSFLDTRKTGSNTLLARITRIS